MESSTGSYREFDHTGDLGIDVEADTLISLFELAAMGMFSLLTDLNAVRPENELEITLGAGDLEALMRNWLSELNYVHLTNGFLLSSASVRRISETELEATVRGEPINLERHPIHTEIKAVTYHEMIVEKRNDRWYGRIIFDI